MGKLSEAYKAHPLKPEEIIPLDFKSIKQIPESHAWTDQIHVDHNNVNQEIELIHKIPTIDLEDPNFLGLLYHACETWGIFQITNHGVSKQVIEEVEFQANRLFSLPFEEKMKALRAPDSASGYGSPRISPFFPKLMWTEGFTIIGDSMVDHAMALWPNDYQEFCDVMDNYQKRMKDLADKLMSFILKSLNIPESTANWVDPTSISTALQLNSYPTCTDPTRTMGLAPHTDTFLFTILHQGGNANGHQIYKDGSGWGSVEVDPGALVVNVGDILHIMSNGRFPNVLHRAVVNTKNHRLSFAYFYGPPLEFEVTPSVDYPGCEGPRYRSLQVKEYVGIKAKNLDLALSTIRI